MLKFIKHHMETINGIDLYPVLSFVIFFSFFLAMLLWIRAVSKRHIDHMAGLPLDDQHSKRDPSHAH